MKKFFYIADTIFYTLLFTAKNILLISAASPVATLLGYLALKTDPAAIESIKTISVLQSILVGTKISLPLMILVVPIYDYEMRRQRCEHLTKIGIISYTASWIICFIGALLLPGKI